MRGQLVQVTGRVTSVASVTGKYGIFTSGRPGTLRMLPSRVFPGNDNPTWFGHDGWAVGRDQVTDVLPVKVRGSYRGVPATGEVDFADIPAVGTLVIAARDVVLHGGDQKFDDWLIGRVTEHHQRNYTRQPFRVETLTPEGQPSGQRAWARAWIVLPANYLGDDGKTPAFQVGQMVAGAAELDALPVGAAVGLRPDDQRWRKETGRGWRGQISGRLRDPNYVMRWGLGHDRSLVVSGLPGAATQSVPDGPAMGQQITSREELRALPVGTVIGRHASDMRWEKRGEDSFRGLYAGTNRDLDFMVRRTQDGRPLVVAGDPHAAGGQPVGDVEAFKQRVYEVATRFARDHGEQQEVNVILERLGITGPKAQANPNELAELKARVWQEAQAGAGEFGWCGTWRHAMTELGITEPTQAYDQEVTVTYRVTGNGEAPDQEAIEQWVARPGDTVHGDVPDGVQVEVRSVNLHEF